MSIQVALFTVGDRFVSGGAKDEAGDSLHHFCMKMGWGIVARQALGSDEQALVNHLIQTADSGAVDVIFTLDGISTQGQDRVPEAMYQVCEKWVPGLPEIIRNKAFEKNPMVALTRGLAGIRGKTLILNLPGTSLAVKEAMEILRSLLRLAVEQIKGTPA